MCGSICLSSIHCQNNLQSSVAKSSTRTITPPPSPNLTLIWNYHCNSLQLFNNCSKHGAKISLCGNVLQKPALSVLHSLKHWNISPEDKDSEMNNCSFHWKKPNICFILRTLVFAFEITVKWNVCYFLAQNLVLKMLQFNVHSFSGF